MNENNISASNCNNEAPTEKLYDHFKNLHSAPEHRTLSTCHLNILDEKKRLEKNKNLYSELDDPISIEEIDKAIKKLKNKKAPGLDRIHNEMLKTSSRFIRASLTKLFMLILKSGAFPTLWSDGVITALHKSGNKDDPSVIVILIVSSEPAVSSGYSVCYHVLLILQSVVGPPSCVSCCLLNSSPRT